MFFVQGLTSNGKEVLVNPDQVLYVGPSGSGKNKSILMLTHSQRLSVDQDIETVKRRFEDYLNAVGDANNRDGLTTEGRDSSQPN
jgi:ribose 1,5-bisphosphokinase PhnN